MVYVRHFSRSLLHDPVHREFDLGPFSFSIFRIIILSGFLRIFLKSEFNLRINSIDWLMIIWALWLISTSIFKQDFSNAIVFRLGIIFDILGTYFLIRIFCT